MPRVSSTLRANLVKRRIKSSQINIQIHFDPLIWDERHALNPTFFCTHITATHKEKILGEEVSFILSEGTFLMLFDQGIRKKARKCLKQHQLYI